tara:strand:+ start:73922 stop:74077 length:156 start_codon:yes stop_codon:yes gene_type:complete
VLAPTINLAQGVPFAFSYVIKTSGLNVNVVQFDKTINHIGAHRSGLLFIDF